MSYLTWLPDVLRNAGLDVYVMPGAASRSSWSTGGMPDIPPGVIWHATATGPNWADGHVAALLRDGRRDLPGPLSQTGVERDGTWVIVALGRCNHDGYGRPWGNKSIGVEVYNDNRGEYYPDRQLSSTQRGIAAILRHLGHPASRCLGHKESASHKVDPLLNMNSMRARVAYHLTALEDYMVTLVIDYHRGFFGIEPGSPEWTHDVVKSVNYHTQMQLGGRSEADMRKDFARTAKVPV